MKWLSQPSYRIFVGLLGCADMLNECKNRLSHLMSM